MQDQGLWKPGKLVRLIENESQSWKNSKISNKIQNNVASGRFRRKVSKDFFNILPTYP